MLGAVGENPMEEVKLAFDAGWAFEGKILESSLGPGTGYSTLKNHYPLIHLTNPH